MRSIFILFYVIATLGATAQNVIRVPQDAATISAAVQQAQWADTIFLSPGLYTDSAHVYSKNLVITGHPNGGSILSPGINQKSFILNNSNVHFMHLTFDDFQQNSPPPNYAISADYSNIKVDQCTFKNLKSPIYLMWGDLEISNCVFSDLRGYHFVQQVGGTFLIYNNLVHGNVKSGMLINRAHGQIFNNTIVGSTPKKHFGIIITPDSISHIYNNIFEGFGYAIYVSASDSAELKALRIYNNNMYNVQGRYRYEYNVSLSSPVFYGALSPNPGTGEINVYSNFVDSANGDFRILPNSSCINAGANAYPFALGRDLDGKNRIVGVNPDIGAYEYAKPFSLGWKDMEFTPAFKVYPQPATGFVWVEVEKDFNGTAEILSVTGQVLTLAKVSATTKFQLRLPQSSGVYLMRLTDQNNAVAIQQILKSN